MHIPNLDMNIMQPSHTLNAISENSKGMSRKVPVNPLMERGVGTELKSDQSVTKMIGFPDNS